jgi:ribonuclease D
LDSIAGTREIALDTEGASFHRFVDRVYLLQLSTRERSAIIDPLPIGTPEGLGALVESTSVEKVFHDADYDLRLLNQDYGWHARNLFDTRIAAQLIGLRAFGLAALLERYFDIKLDKKHQRADWSMRPLTDDMLRYAAQDTMHLLDLRDRLRGELERLGRWSWAREEFARLEGTRWERDDAAEAFLRLKGARDLTRRQLASLRELVPWRDAIARELDRSTFRVVGNDALLEIARQAPRTREALASIKGISRSVLEQRGETILAAVERGLAVPESELPRFPRAPRWDRDPDFDDRVARLKAVRDRTAVALELDPGVLCPRERLEAVARRQPATLDELAQVPDMRRWQAEVMGDELLRALRGTSPKPEGASAPEGSPYADD